MNLNLIVPVPAGAPREPGDEELNGRLWRVTGPHSRDLQDLKYHCVSYAWGPGVVPVGSFFNNQIELSDKTRPALEAAIKAVVEIYGLQEADRVDAFWIDAICIPQLDKVARHEAFERHVLPMGSVYHAAASVITVLESPTWRIVKQASSHRSPEALSLEDMHVLEADPWISRVWTYQELVNSRVTYFTCPAVDTELEPQTAVVEASLFFNCVGYSLACFKRDAQISESTAVSTFPNLNVLEDTLLDRTLSSYLKRPALGILGNISKRSFDPRFPQSRLLASVGALTAEASWGPPSDNLCSLSEKIMEICEAKGDYSFVYTADERSTEAGRTWRPDGRQAESGGIPAHLLPIINWPVHGGSLGETQRGRTDEHGFWLEDMVPLLVVDAIDHDAKAELDRLFWGRTDPENPDQEASNGILGQEGERGDWLEDLVNFFLQIGYTGFLEPKICETGLFFSQKDLTGREDVELFASASLSYAFGSPGLATWREEGVMRTCAGVFVGLVRGESAQSLLMV